MVIIYEGVSIVLAMMSKTRRGSRYLVGGVGDSESVAGFV
jgi:hypothetical protein